MNEFFRGTITRRDWAIVLSIAFGAIGLCALFYFVILENIKASITENETKIAALQVDIAAAKKMQANIEDLRAESRKYQTLVDEFEKRLPQSAEIPRLLQEFERMAGEAGVSVELATLSRARDSRKEEIPYSVTAKGNFHQVSDFINRLERYERYLKVSKLNISEEKEGLCTAKFTLSTYAFIQRPQPSGAPQPGATPAPAAGGNA